jgi:hypothetical protein
VHSVPSYFGATWHASPPGEPVYIWHELADDRTETRKIEEFRDGVRLRADVEHPDGETALSSEPMPSLEFIDAQDEFSTQPLTKAEFEEVWASAQYQR